MALDDGPKPRAYERYAWALLFVLSIALALNSLYIVAAGPDPRDFAASTGTAWADLEAGQPKYAAYVDRLIRLLGVSFAGFALLGAAVAATAFRRLRRWSWYALLVMPLVLAGAAAIFFIHEAGALGIFYAAVTGLALLGLLLPVRVVLGPSTPKPAGN